MRIEFKQISPIEIAIMGIEGNEKRVIGRIFTPSGSGRDCLNAIQVCGFKEAFDYWGCGVFEYLKNEDKRQRIINSLKNKKQRYISAKDIQLMFSFNTQIRKNYDFDLMNICCRCYNRPCTCEEHKKGANPYKVKREKDLPIEKIEK